MTIYWERCDLCGLHAPTLRCTLVNDIFVDAHCCLACPHWMNKCKNPAWKFELAPKAQQRYLKPIRVEERQKLLDELMSLLEAKSSSNKTA